MKQLVLTHLFRADQGLNMNLGEWEGVLLRVMFYWLVLTFLGIPYLHGETIQEYQALAEQILI